jgi:hypothetical protein
MNNRKELLHPAAEAYILKLETKVNELMELISGVSSTKRGPPDVVVGPTFYYNGLQVSEWCKTALGKSHENGTLKIEAAALEIENQKLKEENDKLRTQVQVLVTIMEKYPDGLNK